MATEINFYQLDDTEFSRFLAVMLGKLYQEQSERILVFSEDNTLLAELDEVIWSFAKTRFIPHALSTDALPEKQPILLTAVENNQNQAKLLVTTGNNQDEFLASFSKVFYVFANKNPQSLQQARNNWKRYKENGNPLKYFYQDEKGSWLQKTDQ